MFGIFLIGSPRNKRDLFVQYSLGVWFISLQLRYNSQPNRQSRQFIVQFQYFFSNIWECLYFSLQKVQHKNALGNYTHTSCCITKTPRKYRHYYLVSIKNRKCLTQTFPPPYLTPFSSTVVEIRKTAWQHHLSNFRYYYKKSIQLHL